MRHWTTSRGTRVIQLLSGRSNAFLVQTESATILVDSGRVRKRKTLLQNIRKTGITAIDYLVLTHTHFDHAENAAFLKREFALKIVVHELEAIFLQKGKNTNLQPLAPWLRFLLNPIIRYILRIERYEPAEPAIIIPSINPDFQLDKSLQVKHTPGHSPGSISIIVDEEIAITGDLIFGVFPVSSTPPFAENEEQLKLSWKKLLSSGCSLYLTGHGRPRTIEMLQKHYSSLT
jgi:hydroxyacylglutathione hydrolase